MRAHRKQDLIPFLAAHTLHAKKSLSQNFLIDRNIIEKIAAIPQIQKTDIVLEIGPGPGALTEHLLEKTDHLTVIEKDAKMAQALASRFTPPSCKIITADVLEWDIMEWIGNISPDKKIKIISNLPYQITSPFLGKFLPLHSIASSLTLMVQKEVAERICAKAGETHYSHLSLLCQLYSDPMYCFDVSRNCFYPRPNVTSAVVMLPLTPPKIADPCRFLQFSRLLFQTRRKMIRAILNKNKITITDPSLTPFLNRRVEELSLNEIATLFYSSRSSSS